MDCRQINHLWPCSDHFWFGGFNEFKFHLKDKVKVALLTLSVLTEGCMSDILVNTGSGNDLLPNGTKLLPGPMLAHWGRVTHICVGKLTIIGSDNGLSPERRQAIIWTNAGILLIGPLGTNVSEILIEIQTFSLRKMRLKMSSAKCCSFRLGLIVLTDPRQSYHSGLACT